MIRILVQERGHQEESHSCGQRRGSYGRRRNVKMVVQARVLRVDPPVGIDAISVGIGIELVENRFPGGYRLDPPTRVGLRKRVEIWEHQVRLDGNVVDVRAVRAAAVRTGVGVQKGNAHRGDGVARVKDDLGVYRHVISIPEILDSVLAKGILPHGNKGRDDPGGYWISVAFGGSPEDAVGKRLVHDGGGISGCYDQDDCQYTNKNCRHHC